jgi:hypothetical protein
MMNYNGKLVAYRPLLATKSIFGYVVETYPKDKYLIDFDGVQKICDKKECTIVFNKKQKGYR